MQARYVIRPDPEGFTVVDTQTGAAALVASAPQRGLSLDDAEHMAGLFNRQADAADRPVA